MIHFINATIEIIIKAVKNAISPTRTAAKVEPTVNVIDNAINDASIVPIVPVSKHLPLSHIHFASEQLFLLAAVKLPRNNKTKNKTASPKVIHTDVTILDISPRLNNNPMTIPTMMLIIIPRHPQAEKLQCSLHPMFSDIS